ncbi:LbetaH domain-containing protein [Acinetobacter haemolyticus]|uniref:acetyltransferase n=1 Tax=Acinetobacter haemolyticus TaxID=29430 RepID=UPI001331D839|nr:acetyltransferase [Acinetobacter haemolyticus]NAR35209.1 acetyltransferase [Acinetobacter haemolyticus]NAR47451.1 acetyltransferase [Acinetobacter haemolyticus]QHI21245.1 acetyltransferase [Acinetobacter haemolyticus]
MTEIYAVYGASGCGRSLMPVARAQLKRLGNPAEIVFIDDSLVTETIINSHRAMNYAAFKAQPATQKQVLIAIANSQVREKISIQLEQDAIELWSVQADNVVLMDEVEIATGAALSPFVSITSNIKIGKCFHANLYSYVEHDCVIGDFVTFAPGVQCNGNIHIHDHAYVGAGAVIKQGTPDQPLIIGRGAVVGMGAVVTKSVPAGVTVIGNPARILEKK